ncbi:GAF domain-containing protein [Sandaracinus amylolyticus]|uniref:PAS sensor protein n=1 Tax=Sandaracinus amylolyticus TaxID=927083 RepID=A0A0F6YGH6_9BACT|nr:GAF domain-containing protein [Sandaracinus amylolyticus]AKF02878.1 PAS sensor protein [Sandaracinus amylolyticus]
MSPPNVITRPSSPPTDDPRDAVLRRHNQILLSLAKSTELDGSDPQRAWRLLTEAATHGIGTERASIWFFDEHRTQIELVDLFERSKAAHSAGFVLKAADYPAYFAALAEDRTIAASDARHHAATREFKTGYLEPLDIHSMLEAPIRRRGKVVGVLCHEHVGAQRTFSREEEQLAASIADLVARTLDDRDRLAAENAMRAANRELEEHKARLEQEVAERTRDLAARNAENQELIRRLRGAVEQLSSPVLELWEDVLAVPVIGVVDSERAAMLVERVLEDVARRNARFVLIDLTGVDVVDTGTADRLVKLARAVELLGARCVLTGLQPLVAQTLVDLGADFGELETLRNLKQGLLHALQSERSRREQTRAHESTSTARR